MSALQRAIQFFESQKAMADALGVSPMTITQWKQRRVPVERCAQIETATDGKVTKQQLRPDIFGAPNKGAAA